MTARSEPPSALAHLSEKGGFAKPKTVLRARTVEAVAGSRNHFLPTRPGHMGDNLGPNGLSRAARFAAPLTARTRFARDAGHAMRKIHNGLAVAHPTRDHLTILRPAHLASSWSASRTRPDSP